MRPLAANTRAIGWMLLAAAAVVAMSAVIKHLTRELPVAVVFFFRMAFAVPLVLPWVARDGLRVLATRRLAEHFARGAVGALSMWCWVFGLKHLPLTTFTAISFTRPLWMPLTGRVMLREHLGGRRAMWIALGFVGVLIAVRPEMQAGVGVLVALIGAVVSSITLAQVKKLTATEPAIRIVFYFSLFGTLCAAPFALAHWDAPTPAQFAWLALSAVVAASAQYCVARAAMLGDATVIAPADFMQLPIAALAGHALFGEASDVLVFAGTMLILPAVMAVAYERGKSR